MDFLTDPWYIGAGLFAVAAIGLGIAYEKGWIGGDKRIVTLIAETEHKLAALRKRFEERVAARAAKAEGAVLQQGAAPGTYHSVTGSTKEQRLDENDTLLARGKITQAEHDAARTVILND